MSQPKKMRPVDGVARTNRFVLITILIFGALLSVGYFVDYLQGYISQGFAISFIVTVAVTAIIDIIVYKVRPSILRYVAVFGYAIAYAQAVWMAKNDLGFTIAFPIIAMFVLYYDYKLVAIIGAVFGSIIVIDVILTFRRGILHSGAPLNMSTLLLEFICTMAYLIVLGEVTVFSTQINNAKLDTIKSMSDRVNDSIRNINGRLEQLNESSVSMKSAMEEVNSGVTDTAEAVQHQLMQTEEIQSQIEMISNAAQTIYASVGETMESVSAGNREVGLLVEEAETSVGISGEVVEKLEVVKKNMDEMNSITKLIDSIAFQTNIMALNANVEAARAGEAGKGFAVVASEISNMSAKTKDATDSIAELIGNVSDSIEELVESIAHMTEVIQAEEEKTNRTSEIFANIESNTRAVSDNADELLRNMVTLTDANRAIVESVQTISAASEEVTALTNQALETEVTNVEVLGDVASEMKELAESTETAETEEVG